MVALILSRYICTASGRFLNFPPPCPTPHPQRTPAVVPCTDNESRFPPFRGRHVNLPYSGLFERFLTLTREKELQARTIGEIIPPSSRSYLDAGAGNGDLSRRLKPRFQRCVVIEPNVEFHAQLATFADEVIAGSIDEVNIKDNFDFILCSHVLGYVPKDRRPDVVAKLFRCLNQNGVLTIVYNSSASDVIRVIQELAPNARTALPRPVVFTDDWIRQFASQRHCLKIGRVKTPIVLSSLDDVITIIQFVAFGDSPLNSTTAATRLTALAESFRTGSTEWTFTTEQEYLCVAKTDGTVNEAIPCMHWLSQSS